MMTGESFPVGLSSEDTWGVGCGGVECGGVGCRGEQC